MYIYSDDGITQIGQVIQASNGCLYSDLLNQKLKLEPPHNCSNDYWVVSFDGLFGPYLNKDQAIEGIEEHLM